MHEQESWGTQLTAAVKSAGLVSGTLGPGGLSKLMVSPLGYSVLSNDAHRILKEVDAGYPLVRSLPAVRALVRLADQQARDVGDGTTTTVLLATGLLRQALALRERGVHPRVVVEGYDLVAGRADRLLEGLALEVEAGAGNLRKMAAVALLGKVEREDLAFFSRLVTRLFLAVRAEGGPEEAGVLSEALEKNLKVFTRPGALPRESRFIDGLVINRHRSDRRMPRGVSDARVGLLDFDLSLSPLKGYPEDISVTDSPGEDSYGYCETSRIEDATGKLIRAGASVLFSSSYLPEPAKYQLARRGILAVERTKRSDMEKLSLATGAGIAKLPEEISSGAMGRARVVEERTIMDNRMTFVEGTRGRVATLFLRSPTRGGLDEAERACRGALRSLAAFDDRPRVLPGGGGVEVYLARELASWSSGLSGKVRLVAGAFGGVLEMIPRTLMANAGIDPLLFLSRLKKRQEGTGNPWIGLNSLNGRLQDMSRGTVWDSLPVKRNALHLAVAFSREMIGVDELLTSNAEGRVS